MLDSGHNMAFKYHISIATNMAANFGCILFRIMLDIVSELKKVKIKYWSSSCQCCFQTSHLICNQFGCKLWLQWIQNHARHRFQAIAQRHLKSQCFLILIWADALFFERLTNEICCFAQDSIWNMWICSYVIFYSKTNEVSKDWAKLWALLWSVTTSRWFIISHKKKKLTRHGQKFTEH